MKQVITIVGVLILMFACLGAGYLFGQPRLWMIVLPGDYVRVVEQDCFHIKRLKEKKTEETLHNLNMNLNQQIIIVDFIRRYAGARDRYWANQLLLDIAQHRSDYELAPRESKEGMSVHGILDQVENGAKMKSR